ncbi:excinuclease ABC subunit UvrC [Xylella taiwanensis]|uniref:UvrABC system protein C n=1 Tax=Xylella taiwanensis TaxID=1444770 RepID=Z9JME1_9GAMM|nr:excinuclease ABC subunit UvrC [Xylella taiwanensis]AXI83328.1 excinuclease ABC subunit C [Xylella taiwanensis]EWS79143.1 excinuclease ABC subunit C [Xylella taiwanensis]MCD8456398.1 excinuclease ABC subunit UvrC [Xylella taiwanensis]MCD8458806.1 excinuclease ABC subunit UvrC [Xylella taiwanensis]MCD8460942.1 excinuclease ABC subunit UvrC [Xylella taiwanensis]
MTENAPITFDGKRFAAQLSTAPGVYRMYAADDTLLYVGKAGALRKRVASYFNGIPKNTRLTAMLAQVVRMDVTITRNEAEALLLENQLIKSLAPRYNVLLRDDKSYPYVLLTREAWPRIALHRGPQMVPGRYFGPYPGVTAVREMLNLMHKLFKLRSCEDSVFRNRSRPCLQYQIGRCSAPCVGLVTNENYTEAVHRVTLFLEGKSDLLAEEMIQAMQVASEHLEFEHAARLRDLLTSLRSMQNRQYVDGRAADLDVLACSALSGQACVLLLSFRDGRNLGTRVFFPKTNGEERTAEILSAFVSQYYAEYPPPPEILLDREIPDHTLLEAALSSTVKRKISLRWNVRGERAGYVELAVRNAQVALSTELTSQSAQRARSEAVRQLLGMDAPIKRVECFDISHTMGEATVASCVVFDAVGPVRSQYRRYNIAGITPGDDYAAMRQAIERRFRHAVKEDEQRELPDVLLIDGGAGQLAQAKMVLTTLGVDSVLVVGVSKGEERRAGHEMLVMPDGYELRPGTASPALQFIQQVRDEAHRFAITGHRGRRQKTRMTSKLEEIPGIGSRRRANLLKHFGGLAGLKAAGQAEIARVEGISAALAARIYASLHGLSTCNMEYESRT